MAKKKEEIALPSRFEKALRRVIAHYLNDERKDFMSVASTHGHIYVDLQMLNSLLIILDEEK